MSKKRRLNGSSLEKKTRLAHGQATEHHSGGTGVTIDKQVPAASRTYSLLREGARVGEERRTRTVLSMQRYCGNQHVQRALADVGQHHTALEGQRAQASVIQRQDQHEQGNAPADYLPPPEIDTGMMPPDAQVVSLNTRDLHNAIDGAHWPTQTRADPGWAGWTIISNMSAPTFWNSANLSAATTSGLRQDLPTQVGAQMDLISSVEFRANIVDVHYEVADRVGISQSATGGGTVGSSGTAGESSTMGFTGGGTMPVGGGAQGTPTPELSAEVSGEIGANASRGGSGGWTGTGTTGTGEVEGVRFSFAVEWEIIIRQELDVGNWATVLSLGTTNLVALASERPYQRVSARSSGRVRFPVVRCRRGVTGPG